MKRKKQECNSPSDQLDPIPNDLMVEIFSRLPGTSLMKFQYLSKFWFSIIRSKRFIDSFFSRSLNRGSRLLITLNNINENGEKRLFFFSASNEGANKYFPSSLVANLDMIIPSGDAHYHFPQGTIVHGFICCSYHGQFLICNLITRQIVTIPKSGDYKFTYNYLGYDPIDDQYKALCMMASQSDYGDIKHKVLTLGRGDNKNHSWRQIKDNTEPYMPSTKGICINGVVYYGASISDKNVIVCFDVRLEKICLMNPPFSIKYWDHDHGTNLINYKGKLAVICTTGLRASHGYGFILRILENVEKREWSKKTYKFPQSWLNSTMISSYSYIGINKTGEIILAPNVLPRNLEPFYIFYCDVTSQDIRRVRLEGIADDEEFMRHYGIGDKSVRYGYISSEYFEDITFL
ncbi:F-box protein [Cardamine amara subsp. amara]|uniref:F-box protein n=1 Tax=Cardamine amara subsp. amara TaxID=228776 RepID=A0ABD0ZN91_CARAN